MEENCIYRIKYGNSYFAGWHKGAPVFILGEFLPNRGEVYTREYKHRTSARRALLKMKYCGFDTRNVEIEAVPAV